MTVDRWQAEVLEVLEGWERVWDALGQPGPLGTRKSEACLAEIDRLRLRSEADTAIREALQQIATMRQEADDFDHPDFDWRMLAQKMEEVARAAF